MTNPASDHAVYRAFYRDSVRALAAHLRRLGAARPEDLEDVIQDTYIEAFKSWDSLRDEEARFAWLLTIGRRQLSRHRAKAARAPLPLADVVSPHDASVPSLPQVAASAPLADAVVESRSTCAQVLSELAAISNTTHRQAIELFYLQEMQLPELSTQTGVKVSTLTTWLSRFRERLRPILADAEKQHAVQSAEPALTRFATPGPAGRRRRPSLNARVRAARTVT